MLWLSWRQLRSSAVAAGAALAALAVVLAVTGPGLVDDRATLRARCGDDTFGCMALSQELFHQHRGAFLAAGVLVLVLPAVLGLFWGAPLVTREIESGTHLLVWNQSITRQRWLAIRFGVVGAATLAVAGLGTLAVTWWASPIDSVAAGDFPRMAPLLFAARGVVPVGYAAFALALGVAVGLVVRRMLPAMAITLAVFVAVQLAVPVLVRPHLVAPIRTTISIADDNAAGFGMERVGPDRVRFNAGDTGVWILSSHTVDADGDRVARIDVSRFSTPCDDRSGMPPPEVGTPSQDPRTCFVAEVADLGYRQEVSYHPADRFWPLQWREAGLYLAGALGLVAFGLWRVRRMT